MTDNKQVQHHQEILTRIARKVMVERGLEPDFPKEAVSQLNRILAPASLEVDNVKDLRHLLWCSIDNDDSLDLDQLTAATLLPDGSVKVGSVLVPRTKSPQLHVC